MNFTSENFDFIDCKHTRGMVESACMALDNRDWNFLKNYYMVDSDSYMFSKNHRIIEIMDKVENAYRGGHSGFSLGFTMRIVDNIAKIGIEEYKKQYCETAKSNDA